MPEIKSWDFFSGRNPHEIREFVKEFICSAKQFPIEITTYSHVVINMFRDYPDYIFVCKEDDEWIPITDIKSVDYWDHFALGGCYENERFTSTKHISIRVLKNIYV